MVLELILNFMLWTVSHDSFPPLLLVPHVIRPHPLNESLTLLDSAPHVPIHQSHDGHQGELYLVMCLPPESTGGTLVFLESLLTYRQPFDEVNQFWQHPL